MTIGEAFKVLWLSGASVTTALVIGASTVNTVSRALRDDPAEPVRDRVALSERDAALQERDSAVRAQKLAELRAATAELRLNELIRGGIFLPVRPAGGEVRPEDLIPKPAEPFPIPERP